MTLPIIDLGSPGEGGGASLTRIAAEVGAACRDVGFFCVVNHGVDPELIAKAFAQSRKFFALPVADKRTLAIETVGGNRGYSGLLHEALDPAQRLARRVGLPRNTAVLLRRVRGARRAIASRVRHRPWPQS